MKVQNNFFGKRQDCNTTMLRQEKCQRAESFLTKKIPTPATTHSHQSTVRTGTIIRTILVTCSRDSFFTFKLPQAFEEYIPIILP